MFFYGDGDEAHDLLQPLNPELEPTYGFDAIGSGDFFFIGDEWRRRAGGASSMDTDGFGGQAGGVFFAGQRTDLARWNRQIDGCLASGPTPAPITPLNKIKFQFIYFEIIDSKHG